MRKIVGVNYYYPAVTVPVTLMDVPCYAMMNGVSPKWVDITDFVFTQDSQKRGEYRDQRLLALSLIHKDSAGVHKLGQKWYIGVLAQKGILLPVPAADDEFIVSYLQPYVSWNGDIYAPYGFAVWTNGVELNDKLYVSAMLSLPPDEEGAR